MNDLQEQLQKQAADMGLTRNEKDAMRMAIQAHMRAHPAKPVPSLWFGWVMQARFMVPALAILLLCVSTTYAAQGALPGDLLYPIKIHINEQVEVALAGTPTKKVAVETSLAERRVGEAQTLAARGALDVSTTKELEDNFNAHAQEAITLATTIEEKEDAEVEQPVAPPTARPMAMTLKITNTDSTSTQSMAAQVDTEATTTRIFKLKNSLKVQSDILHTLKKDEVRQATTTQEH